jgi:hypothetical protein
VAAIAISSKPESRFRLHEAVPAEFSALSEISDVADSIFPTVIIDDLLASKSSAVGRVAIFSIFFTATLFCAASAGVAKRSEREISAARNFITEQVPLNVVQMQP